MTITPSDWALDSRLSRRARGLLLEIFERKRNGSYISIYELQATGPEGRDALRAGMAELISSGYLRRVMNRSDGIFDGVSYEIEVPN